jgi:DNA-binding MarR family transcriptional regulator
LRKVMLIYSEELIACKLKEERRLSRTEQLILDYIKRSKRSRETVWLSEAIEELGIDPREAVQSAKLLEEQGLVKPKHIG